MNIDNGIKNIAKVSYKKINDIDNTALFDLLKEIFVVSKLNYPSILKFYGYNLTNFKNKPKPVIIFEYVSELTLDKVLSQQNAESSTNNFDDTKKLIIIYGIASAISYLHSHSILHRGLDAKTIFLDEKFYPKLSGFDNSIELKFKNQIIESKMNDISKYHSPEIKSQSKYSKSSDVYAFAIIMLEIMSNQIFINSENDFKKTIDSLTKDCYLNLINKCMSENPKERPSFEYIVKELKNNPDFIKSSVNSEEFHNYIKFIDESKISFSESKQHQKLNELLKFDKTKINSNLRGSSNNGSYQDLTKPSSNLNDYILQDKIGSGSFGKVFRVKEKNSKIIYAAKISIDEINESSYDLFVNISREVNIISKLNHPSVLKFILYSPINFKNKNKPVIITEYASNGSLLQYIEKDSENPENPILTDTHKLILIYGIAAGMSYLHSHGILHRDLKPDNILLNDFLFPVISDFGLSKSNDSDVFKSMAGSIKGTPVYISPEIWSKREYSEKSDVYAFAFVVYELMTLDKPFKRKNLYEIMLLVGQCKRPIIKESVPKAYRELIERCWSQDPSNRLTFKEIITNLESNPEFITTKVNKKKFFNYIKLIKKYKTTFNSGSVCAELNSFIKFIKKNERKIKDDKNLPIIQDYLNKVRLFPFK